MPPDFEELARNGIDVQEHFMQYQERILHSEVEAIIVKYLDEIYKKIKLNVDIQPKRIIKI